MRLAEIVSDSVITDDEWLAVREMVYGANHGDEAINEVKRSKPRARRAAPRRDAGPAPTPPARVAKLRLVPPLVEPAPPPREAAPASVALVFADWPSVLLLRAKAGASPAELPRILSALAAQLEADIGDAARSIDALDDSAGPSQVLDAMEGLIAGYAALASAARTFAAGAALTTEQRVMFTSRIGDIVASQLGPSKKHLPQLAERMSSPHRERALALLALVDAVLAAQ